MMISGNQQLTKKGGCKMNNIALIGLSSFGRLQVGVMGIKDNDVSPH